MIDYDDVEYFEHRAAPAGKTARDMALVDRVEALEVGTGTGTGTTTMLDSLQDQIDAEVALGIARQAEIDATEALDVAQQAEIDANETVNIAQTAALSNKEDSGVAATLDAALQAQIDAKTAVDAAQQAAIDAAVAVNTAQETAIGLNTAGLATLQSQLDAQAAIDAAQEAVDVANKAVDDAQTLAINNKEDAGVAATLDALIKAQADAADVLNAAQQTQLDAADTLAAAQQLEIDAAEAVNTAQQAQIDAIDTSGKEDAGVAATLDAALQAQITAANTAATALQAEIDAAEAVNVAQQAQLDAADTLNTAQTAAINNKEDAGVAAALDAAIQAQVTANATLNTAQQTAITANIAAIAALQASIVKPDYEAAESDAAGILNKPKTFRDVAEVLADTRLQSEFVIDEVIRTEIDRFSYIVADAGATDNHVVTAGGVKLYVQPTNDGAYNVKAFGAALVALADDTDIINTAIQCASEQGGGEVLFPIGRYVHESLINIPDGVRLVGVSRGEKILGGITEGSILNYRGLSDGIYLNGSMAGIKNMALVGTFLTTGVGLQLNGDGNSVESWLLKDVSIYGYTKGTALKLVGINSGYVAYGYAESLRIRDCLVGIHILDSGGGAGFVNTNQFYGGGIAGGGPIDYCIRVQGGNDNRFTGMSVESSSSEIAHISVESGWINFDGRIEGASQPVDVPLVEFSTGTQSSTIAGVGADGLIIDPDRKNNIKVLSSKSPKPQYSSGNIFDNAGFSGVVASGVTSWDVAGAGVTFSSTASDFVSNCNTLTVTVPAGVSCVLSQNLDTTLYSGAFLSMGLYAKTASAETVSFSMTDGVSTTAGQRYLSDDTLQFVGHRKNVALNPSIIKAQINLNNSAGATDMVVDVTMPMVVVGSDMPYPSARVLDAGYAVMSGLFSTSFGGSTEAISQIVLPQDGNNFVITGGTGITRVNQALASRFPNGAEITLFADSGANLSLSDGVYLLLNGPFSAAKEWDNITLVHIGNGRWVEKCRVNH